MSSTVAPLRSCGMTEAMCLHLMLGKSPRKWLGAVGTPYRSRLWNHSPSSSMRRARASRSICGGAVVLFVLVSCRWPMDIVEAGSGALKSSTAPLGRLDARTQVEMPARVAANNALLRRDDRHRHCRNKWSSVELRPVEVSRDTREAIYASMAPFLRYCDRQRRHGYPADIPSNSHYRSQLIPVFYGRGYSSLPFCQSFFGHRQRSDSVLIFDWFFDQHPQHFDLNLAGLEWAIVLCSVSLLVASLETQRRKSM